MDRYGAQRCFANGDRVSWEFKKRKKKKEKLVAKQTVVMKRGVKKKGGRSDSRGREAKLKEGAVQTPKKNDVQR